MKLLLAALLLPPGLLQGAAPSRAAADDPAPAVPGGGWVELFDGETLAGWTTRGGRYDGDARWTVEDGAIVGREGPDGQGGLLYTEDLYTAFELELEVAIDHPFDSGVFLRMTPDEQGAQVTLDHRPGGEIGAIYSDGFLLHNEAGARLFRSDEWNHLRVRSTGFDFRIQAWLNGEELVDYHLPAGAEGYACAGRIGLQVHGGGEAAGSKRVRFKDVRARRLPVFADAAAARGEGGATTPTDAAAAAGWRALFDGRSLAGWQPAGATGCYETAGGELRFLKAGEGGDLFTEEDFDDFRLRLEFQAARMANSGVFLRVARDGSNPAYSGCELQLLDDLNWERVTGTTLSPWQKTASLYGAVPAGDHDVLRPPGEWNLLEVLYRGPRLAVALNGLALYDVDTHALEVDPPFASRAPAGPIGLQRYSAEHADGPVVIRFRDVLLQEL